MSENQGQEQQHDVLSEKRSAGKEEMGVEGQGPELRLALTYGDIKAEFSGTPESVLQSVNTFIANQLPAFSLAKKLALNYSLNEMIDKFQNYIRVTPEGPRVILQEDEDQQAARKLSDKEIVAAQLVAQRIAFETGVSKSSSASLASLQESTSLNPKSLSSRLSELSKLGYVVRESGEEGTSFRISTQGISWLIETLERKNNKA